MRWVVSSLHTAIEAHKGGQFMEAEAAYRRILEGDPRNADALNFLGMLKCQTGNARDAVELLQRSVEVDGTNPHAWLNYGNALLVDGDKEQVAFGRAPEENRSQERTPI